MHLSSFRRPAAGLLAAVPLAAALAACGPPSPAPSAGAGRGTVSVVASTNVWGDVARRVGGDRVTVSSIISKPDQDPHSFEAGTRNQLQLSRAAVVVENGGGYDDFVPAMLKGARNAHPRIVDAVAASGRRAPAGGELNEHVWYDFTAVGKVAGRIAGALAAADPGHAAEYRRNAAAFTRQLAPLKAREAALKAAHGGRGIAVTEPVPLYLTEAAGLVDRTPPAFSRAVEEGGDVSPKALHDTLALLAGKRVSVLLYNAQASDAAADRVRAAAREHGVPVVPVTETVPDGQDYLGWMRGTLDALDAALKG